jgi:hypothetical protein
MMVSDTSFPLPHSQNTIFMLICLKAVLQVSSGAPPNGSIMAIDRVIPPDITDIDVCFMQKNENRNFTVV